MSLATITRWAAESRRGQVNSGVTLLALVYERTGQARLTAALREAGRLVVVDSVDALDAQLRLAGSLGGVVVVLEPIDRAGTPTADAVRRIREQHPRVPVLGYCRLSGSGSDDVVGLVRAGVHDLIFRDVDDSGIAVRAAIARAQRTSAAMRVIDALRDDLTAEGVRVVEHAVMYGRRRLTVPDVARSLGVTRRSLVNWCARSRLPAPQVLLAWGRLFLAAEMMEHAGQTLEQIAVELDYSSAPALHNAMARYVGCRARDVRANGGLEWLLAEFQRRRAVGELR